MVDHLRLWMESCENCEHGKVGRCSLLAVRKCESEMGANLDRCGSQLEASGDHPARKEAPRASYMEGLHHSRGYLSHPSPSWPGRVLSVRWNVEER